jgi:integrase
MDMPKLKLTKTAVESQTPQKEAVILHDTEVSGFQAKVTPTGRRIYQVWYRTKEGKERRPKIGEHGVFTVQQARDRARVILGAVHKGEDPAAALQALKAAPSMEDLCGRYMSDHAEIHKAASSISEDASMIRNYILPFLGSTKVSSVTPIDVQKLHLNFKKFPHRANRLVALLSKMFGLAEQWGLRDPGTNPTRSIKLYKEERRQRFISIGELERLGDELDNSDRLFRKFSQDRGNRVGAELPQVTAFFRLLLLTGCRLNEIRTLRWEFIDWDNGLLRLPDTKTGLSIRPLGRPALEYLTRLHEQSVSEWVIPSMTDPTKPFVNIQKAWRRIRARCDLEDVRIHDIRHSLGATATGLGNSLPIIAKMLGHSQISTTSRYAHVADGPLRQATDQVSREIASKLFKH